jgi:hypothetical protein
MPAGSKQPVVVHYVEHMPSDVTAGIFTGTRRTGAMFKMSIMCWGNILSAIVR